MADEKQTADKQSTGTQPTEQVLKRELRVFRALRPYFGRCLTMNHDLNNPLTGIIGYTEFLLMDSASLSQDQVACLKHIAQCAEEMKEVVEGLSETKLSASTDLDLKDFARTYNAVATASD